MYTSQTACAMFVIARAEEDLPCWAFWWSSVVSDLSIVRKSDLPLVVVECEDVKSVV